jgi:hypothetical protein
MIKVIKTLVKLIIILFAVFIWLGLIATFQMFGIISSTIVLILIAIKKYKPTLLNNYLNQNLNNFTKTKLSSIITISFFSFCLIISLFGHKKPEVSNSVTLITPTPKPTINNSNHPDKITPSNEKLLTSKKISNNNVKIQQENTKKENLKKNDQNNTTEEKTIIIGNYYLEKLPNNYLKKINQDYDFRIYNNKIGINFQKLNYDAYRSSEDLEYYTDFKVTNKSNKNITINSEEFFKGMDNSGYRMSRGGGLYLDTNESYILKSGQSKKISLKWLDSYNNTVDGGISDKIFWITLNTKISENGEVTLTNQSLIYKFLITGKEIEKKKYN